jgi:hypothetical protein
MIQLPVRLLKIIIVLYLLLPNLLFQAFWFRTEIAFATITGLLLSFYFYIKPQYREEKTIIGLTYAHVIILAIFALFLVVLSGMAGFSYQTNDYVGHNSKFYDLTTNPWPIYFEGADTFGCYYWGFYLVPALIGKLTGQLSVTAIFLWTYFGVLLGITMAFILLKKSVTKLVLFLIIGGIGHTVKVVFGLLTGIGFARPDVFIEVWNLLNQLLWAPNQLIPTLLLVSLLYYEGILQRNILSCFFPLTLVLIWSVFPSLIMSLIALFTFLYFGEYQKFFGIGWAVFLQKIVLPGLVCLPVLVYFLSSSGAPISGFLWTYNPIKPVISDYIICVILDIVFLWIIWKYLVDNRKEVPNSYFYGLLFFIPVFALYRFGFANDLLVRGTMPVFMILFYAIFRGNPAVDLYQNGTIKPKFKLLIAGLIILCLVGPLSFFYRSLTNNILVNKLADKQIFTPYPYDKYPNTYEAVKSHHSDAEGAQYLGNKKSAYWQYLSKKNGTF